MFKLALAALLFASPVYAASIDISNANHTLTFHGDDGTAQTFPVAVGKLGAAVRQDFVVGQKRENPSWTPTPHMIKFEHHSPRTVPPGPHNPLGPRILHLYTTDGKYTYYGIHGTNSERSSFIKGKGQSVSHGCFRMRHNDILHLYDEVPIGTPVHVF